MGVRTTEQVKLSVEHADVAVMCLGLDATIEGEQGDAGNEYASGDKLGLNLPGLQEELLETVAAMGKLPVRFYHGTENLPVWNIRDDYERREDIPAGSSGAGSGTAL